MGGCTADGELDMAKFSNPLPWVGMYIAAGSLVCFLCISGDMIQCVRHGSFRLRIRYFPLNAATLTFLSVATKFSVDINTAMPGRADQLLKLSAMVLLCVAMNHFIPSLGSMSNVGMLSNVAALVILVVTVIVNICTQIGTGVIYTFLPEHAVVMSIAFFILVLTASTAIQAPALRECIKRTATGLRSIGIGIRGPLDKFIGFYIVFARFCSMEYIIGRCSRFTCSTILCTVASGILAEAMVRSFVGGVEFCRGGSDYGWCTTPVLFIQAASVFVGTLLMTYRCMTTTSRKEIPTGVLHSTDEEGWYRYMVTTLDPTADHQSHNNLYMEMKRWWARSKASSQIVSLLVSTQKGITIFCSLLHSSIPAASSKLWWKLRGGANVIDSGSFLLSISYWFNFDLIDQEGLTDAQRCAKRWMDVRGVRTKHRSSRLIEKIKEKHSSCEDLGGFRGVLEFINDSISRIGKKDLAAGRYGWTLSIVSLVRIAVGLRGRVLDTGRLFSLIDVVRESLGYIKLVDRLDDDIIPAAADYADKIWRDIDHLSTFLSQQGGTNVDVVTKMSPAIAIEKGTYVDVKAIALMDHLIQTATHIPDITWHGINTNFIGKDSFRSQFNTNFIGEDSFRSQFLNEFLSCMKIVKDPIEEAELIHLFRSYRCTNTDEPIQIKQTTLVKDAINSMTETELIHLFRTYRCTYHILSTIRHDYGRTGQRCETYPFWPRTDHNTFDWIETTVFDLLHACVVILPDAMIMNCVNSSPETMEGVAKNTAILWGQIGNDIKPLEHRVIDGDLLKRSNASLYLWRQILIQRSSAGAEQGEGKV